LAVFFVGLIVLGTIVRFLKFLAAIASRIFHELAAFWTEHPVLTSLAILVIGAGIGGLQALRKKDRLMREQAAAEQNRLREAAEVAERLEAQAAAREQAVRREAAAREQAARRVPPAAEAPVSVHLSIELKMPDAQQATVEPAAVTVVRAEAIQSDARKSQSDQSEVEDG
jgi:hypothetical protein